MKDELSPNHILCHLKTRFLGRIVIYHPSLPSTMDVAKAAGRGGAAEGTIVIADQQTAGRGRLKRAWLSPRGAAIALSLILRPSLAELPRLTMVASLAVAHSIERVTRLKPDIKWPNDVLINGRKVCGILIDSDLRGDTVNWAIIGIGLNVNLDPRAFPEISAMATSLSAELGHEVSRLEVLRALLEEMERFYLALREGQPVHEQWRDRLETLGRRVKVSSGGKVEQGEAEGVDSDGSLLLRRSDGTLVTIVAGDVTLRE